MVLLMVVRPLVKQVIGPGVARTLLPAATPAIAAAGEVPVDSPGRDSPTMKMLELARVNGEVQQKSIEKIGELVKTNPAESVAVLRQWINDRN
jgi:flagellar M-ring protein FliF